MPGMEVTFETPWPLEDDSANGPLACLPLEINSPRDALSTLDGSDSHLSLPDPNLNAGMSSLEPTEGVLLKEFYPLRNSLEVTITHFWTDREETHRESLGALLERPRWGNRKHKMFLQNSKIRRDGRFTWMFVVPSPISYSTGWLMRAVLERPMI